MEEDPTRNASRSGTDNPKRNRRFAVEETVDSVDCSSKSCRSCAAALIADCVAVSCCPLAVVSLLALAFVKVPYLVCRKCLKRRRRERKRKKIAEVSSDVIEASSGGCSSSGQGKSDIMFEFGGDEDEEELEDRKSFCAAALEADKVLFELYQVGHLGFGRVSFTGIQSLGKGS